MMKAHSPWTIMAAPQIARRQASGLPPRTRQINPTAVRYPIATIPRIPQPRTDTIMGAAMALAAAIAAPIRNMAFRPR